MIYEIRVYDHAEGKAEAVLQRFIDEVVPRLPDHGIDLVGVFVDEDSGKLTYISQFPDDAARKAGWESFKGDEGWLAAKVASEANGPLVTKQHISVLRPAIGGLTLA